MLDILESCFETSIAHTVDLIHIRKQKRKITTCIVKNGIAEFFSTALIQGIGIRALLGGSWGFSSTSLMDKEHILHTLHDACALATTQDTPSSRDIHLDAMPAVEDTRSSPVKISPSTLTEEDIIRIPMEACNGAKESGPALKEITATFICIEDKKKFLSSEGSRITQDCTRVMLYVDALAKKNDLICPASENLGHTGGLELFNDITPYMVGKQVGDKAIQLLKARSPPSGMFPVVIHPTLCATLLHEAIGHPLEADLAMAGGGFGSQVGNQVSSPLITIYDDGLLPHGLGYIPYDDEGISCKKTVLIEEGRLISFMHDRTSAALSGVPPTGNAHAWDYSVEPLIRQTTIGIEPGEFTEEEMIEDITEGLYLQGTFGGQADSNADFTFGFQNAFWIHHGTLGEEVRGANVAGNAIEVFETVDAVGKEAMLRPGACGKFQFAIQGRKVPAIRCNIMVGGSGK
ncbi:MAG: TldD/PmbA family protein [Theionarchaea archaeon]|nr:TldD/PmbA family protein [Theionarchaea archaeon]